MLLTHSIPIKAPKETVWRTQTDVERWPEMTSTVTSVKRLDTGDFRVGSEARIKQPGMPECVWRVIEMTEGQSFSWGTTCRGIKFVGTHTLTPTGDGCISELRLEMRGILATLLWPIVKSSAQKALATENAGLKQSCENLERP